MSEVINSGGKDSGGYSSETIRRKTVGITLSQDLYAISREYGINLPKLLESSLIKLLDAQNKPFSFGTAFPLPKRKGVVLRPGFEPGSVAREATILDRTILPELE